MILLATLLIHFTQLAVLACVTVIMFSEFSCRDWSLTFVLFLQSLREKAKKKRKRNIYSSSSNELSVSLCLTSSFTTFFYYCFLIHLYVFIWSDYFYSIHGNASTFGCLLKTTQHDSGWGYSYGWEQEQTIETRFVVDCKTLLQKGPHTDMNTSMP